jgi:hypothetical protein
MASQTLHTRPDGPVTAEPEGALPDHSGRSPRLVLDDRCQAEGFSISKAIHLMYRAGSLPVLKQ